MDLANMIRGVVQEMIDQRGTARHARVTSVDPARSLVKVAYDEEGTVSGWLPIAQQAAGNGWSMVTLPEPGQQAFVIPDMGDQAHGVVVGFTHFDAMRPGQITPYGGTTTQPLRPGEPTLMGPSGQFIRLARDGTIHSRGSWVHDGDLKVRGDISDKDGVHSTLDVLRQNYNTHDHRTSVGVTTKPTP